MFSGAAGSPGSLGTPWVWWWPREVQRDSHVLSKLPLRICPRGSAWQRKPPRQRYGTGGGPFRPGQPSADAGGLLGRSENGAAARHAGRREQLATASATGRTVRFWYHPKKKQSAVFLGETVSHYPPPPGGWEKRAINGKKMEKTSSAFGAGMFNGVLPPTGGSGPKAVSHSGKKTNQGRDRWFNSCQGDVLKGEKNSCSRRQIICRKMVIT